MSCCICWISFLIVCVFDVGLCCFDKFKWQFLPFTLKSTPCFQVVARRRGRHHKTSSFPWRSRPVTNPRNSAANMCLPWCLCFFDTYVQYVRYFDVMPVGRFVWIILEFGAIAQWIDGFCSRFGCKKGSINFWFPNLLLFSSLEESPLGLVEEDAGTFWMRFVTWPCLDSCDLCIEWKRRSWSS